MVRNSSSRYLGAIEEQVYQKKFRRSSDIIGSDLWDAEERIKEIRKALLEYSDLLELRRHAIVSSIACLQSYHRGFLSAVMHHDNAMMLRGSSLIGEKYTLAEILRISGNKSIGIEEIIAHSAPCNSIQDIMNSLCRIFDKDFKLLLKNAVSPSERNSESDVSYILDDPDELLAKLSTVFEMRHILAHEAAPNFEISFEAAQRAVDSVEQWIQATQGVLWQTVLLNEPLTQWEISIAASRNIEQSKRRLASALVRIRKSLAGGRRSDFSRNHGVWKANVLDFARLSYGSNIGSLWSSVNSYSVANMFDARSQELEDWAEYLELS